MTALLIVLAVLSGALAGAVVSAFFAVFVMRRAPAEAERRIRESVRERPL